MCGGCVWPHEGEAEEKQRFWNELDRFIDRLGNEYRLCVLGDQNGWDGDRLRAGITGGFQDKMVMVRR